METSTSTKGSLHFTVNEKGDFVCNELAQISTTFSTIWTEQEIETVTRNIIQVIVDNHRIRTDNPENEYYKSKLSDDIERQKRQDIFQKVCTGIAPTGNLLQQFLFWCGHWWYYHPELMTSMRIDSGNTLHERVRAAATKYLVPALPEQVQQTVRGMEIANAAVGFGHFALLFVYDRGNPIRRIVTDTQLFELHDVRGYTYLDILPSGKPVARSATSRDGERAFFDGNHLMSHPRFQTCAPKTVVTDWGYKVNSTGVTIINGILYPLIDVDDAVAHTTGAFLGICEFGRKDQLVSLQLGETSAKRLTLQKESTVVLDEKQWKPIGRFEPSATTLLDTGFTRYDWSVFRKKLTPQYSTILIVDDNQGWVDQVVKTFTEENAGDISSYVTQEKSSALTFILHSNPDALILDMHLTDDEQFDGLWIANQLFASDFAGDILIASSYRDDALQAMQALIKRPVQIPGKNIERIRSCLFK